MKYDKSDEYLWVVKSEYYNVIARLGLSQWSDNIFSDASGKNNQIDSINKHNDNEMNDNWYFLHYKKKI